MHFRRDRAHAGPRRALGGKASVRHFSGVFADRERIPDFDAVIDQHRNAARGRQGRDLLLIVACVQVHDLFSEFEADFAQE